MSKIAPFSFKIRENEWTKIIHKPHELIVLYFILRKRMNFNTGYIGQKPFTITYNDLGNDLKIAARKGNGNSAKIFTKTQIVGFINTLVKLGLVKKQTPKGEQELLLFLPLAELGDGQNRSHTVKGRVSDTPNLSPDAAFSQAANTVSATESHKHSKQGTDKKNICDNDLEASNGDVYQDIESGVKSGIKINSYGGCNDADKAVNEIVSVLTRNGIKNAASSSYRTLYLNWLERKIRLDDIASAIQKLPKGKTSIYPPYLDPIVQECANTRRQMRKNPVAL